MNTYSKFCPNVFLAKCSEKHEKGETILVETKYGKENESVVFNLIYQKDEYYYYSIIRVDGFNAQEFAKKKAERLQNIKSNAIKKSNQYYEASNEGKSFLSLGQPILIGHHSEKSHRALIDRNWNRMGKAVEFSNKAESYESRIDYWRLREDKINLSMPECLEYYEFKLEEAKEKHEGLKNGTIEKAHSFSLIYAKKEVNEADKNIQLAKRLWS